MKHVGNGFAVLYMIPKALLVDDALKLQCQVWSDDGVSFIQ